MTTANQELVKINYELSGNGQLVFPSPWTRREIADKLIAFPTEEDLHACTVGQHYPIGTQLRMNGKLYRYSKAGEGWSGGYPRGAYLQCPGKAGNSANSGFEGAFYAAVEDGDESFQIADTAAAKNEYENAMLVIYDTTNNSYQNYTIIANDATNSTTTTCYLAYPGLKYDTTTSSGITIYRNPYIDTRSVVNKGGYMTCTGMASFPVTSAYYFWLQTAGPCSGMTCNATWPGQTQYYRDVFIGTDGMLGTYATGIQRVGYLLSRTASDYGDNFIMLQLDQ